MFNGFNDRLLKKEWVVIKVGEIYMKKYGKKDVDREDRGES